MKLSQIAGRPSRKLPPALGAVCLAAADAADVVRTALEKRLERWEGVDDYTVYGTFRGSESVRYYEKITVDGRPAFRLVPPTEYEGRELEEAGLAGGLPTRTAPGDGALPLPDGIPGATEPLAGLTREASGAADDLTGGSGSGGLLGRAGGAAAGAARGELQRELMQRGMQGLLGGLQDDAMEDAQADARIEAMMFEVLAREARLAGVEKVDGRDAIVLLADDLSDIDLGAASDAGTDVR
ncbi:MAG TPA: hypothetical protein ENO23_04510, partial [Alphaproteobacteria bacterium]|nr:hypothetical protein [Alphaproteobacteria bacterium]